MIGWRPYVLTLLAVALVAAAVVDTEGSRQKAKRDAEKAQKKSLAAKTSCSAADKARVNGLLVSAARRYRAVLAVEASSSCASSGLEETLSRECAHAKALARVDRAQGRKELLRLASSEPVSARRCALAVLGRTRPRQG
jgi:hypothetical protein